MVQGTVPTDRAELDRFIEAYESAQGRDGSADLAGFLPPEGHPLRLRVLRELIRVELEYGWERGQPTPLEEYRRRFPELFADRDSVGEIAFEEYRLRRQAGQAPSPAEYQEGFGISVAGWPVSLPARRPAAPNGAFPEPGTEFLGFRLLGELGRGAFGRVYLAEQGDLANRLVALKVSRGVASAEPQALARLQHTNIVPIHSIHSAGPFLAVCMPYFGGTTLAHVLKELRGQAAWPSSGKGLVHTLAAGRSATRQTDSATPASASAETAPATPVPPADAALPLKRLEGLSYVEAVVWLGARLADGLAHAHERGILHRDLKPANVLLTDEGQPMLLDFNLSADTRHGDPAAAQLGGTLPYMAPEHLDAFHGAAAPVDARSDIYSLGVVLFELLTGRHPVPAPAGSLLDLLPRMKADRQGPPPRLRSLNREVSPAVEAVVRRCLEPDPQRRYPSARALQEDLDRHLANLPLKHTPEPSLGERLAKWRKRHPRLTSRTTVAAVAGVLALLLAALYVVREQRLARLQAEADARVEMQRLHDDMGPVLYLLNPRSREPDKVAEGLERCRRALERYQVAEDEAWQITSPDSTPLREDQGRLKHPCRGSWRRPAASLRPPGQGTGESCSCAYRGRSSSNIWRIASPPLSLACPGRTPFI